MTFVILTQQRLSAHFVFIRLSLRLPRNTDLQSTSRSYVDGYSVPITCSCSGKAVTGCNCKHSSSTKQPLPIPTLLQYHCCTTKLHVATKVQAQFVIILKKTFLMVLLRSFSLLVRVQRTLIPTTMAQIRSVNATRKSLIAVWVLNVLHQPGNFNSQGKGK